MKKIYLLLDYKNRFGSRYDSVPYRSGMNKEELSRFFSQNNLQLEFLKFIDVRIEDGFWKNTPVLYTSQEDKGHKYKLYIEDVIYALELKGAHLIPEFRFLKAHDNKVFLGMLEKQYPEFHYLKSSHFGCFEELAPKLNEIEYPVVIKSASGAMSRGVFLAKNQVELIKYARKISKSIDLSHDLKEFGRKFIHKGYQIESKYRNKFIIQEYLPNLHNDWKVLVYGDKIYILHRRVKKDDFRASGSKLFDFNSDSLNPPGIFDFAINFRKKLKVPFISLDVVQSNGKFFVVEHQVLNFGTSTHLKSNGYFIKDKNTWIKKNETLALEKLVADSVTEYLMQ